MTTKLQDETIIPNPQLRPRAYPVTVPMPSPVIIDRSTGGCACSQSASGFEQKIKENPLVFVLGALAIGYMLAKK